MEKKAKVSKNKGVEKLQLTAIPTVFLPHSVLGAKYLRYWKNHLSFDNGKIFADVT